MRRALLIAIGVVSVQLAWGQADRGCLACHPAPGLWSRLVKGVRTHRAGELERFKGEAHQKLSCTACHPGTQLGPHPATPKSLSCEECHMSGRGVGGRLMPLIDQLHIQARGAPNCKDCHGHHGVGGAQSTGSVTARENVAKLCARCHENPQRAADVPQVADFAQSIHATGRGTGKHGGPAAGCTDCHSVHATDARHDVTLFPARTREPQTCGRCHTQPLRDYQHSVHGASLRARPEAMPVCTDCHGKHDIRRVSDPHSPASHQRLVATCDRCHGNADFANEHNISTLASKTYRDSYHGIAYRYGNKRSPTCASCHSAHKILPAASVDSPTSTANVPTQCAQCHRGAQSSPQIGKFHVLPRTDSSWLLFIIQMVYMLLVFGSFAGFAAYILFDLIAHRRLVKAGIEEQFEHRLQHLPRPPRSSLVRMFPIERLQHFLLLASFIILALTGIALLVPDTIVGRAIIWLCGGISGRAIVHRVAAGVMVGNFLFQTIWMATTRRGRQNVRDLFPGLSDIRDLWQTVVLFLGFTRNRPSFGRYGFAEKFEFWALVWGTGVMTLTGLLLSFVGWSLGVAPKWVLDAALLVHKWEAILAVGAIAIWHMYHVVWKPGVYPGNRAWLTGEISFEQMVLEHPREYARAMGWLTEPDGDTEESKDSPSAKEEGEAP